MLHLWCQRWYIHHRRFFSFLFLVFFASGQVLPQLGSGITLLRLAFLVLIVIRNLFRLAFVYLFRCLLCIVFLAVLVFLLFISFSIILRLLIFPTLRVRLLLFSILLSDSASLWHPSPETFPLFHSSHLSHPYHPSPSSFASLRQASSDLWR